MPLKEEDQIKEQIRFNTEIIKLMVVGVIASLGGVISLVITRGSNGVENFFTAGGMILVVIFIVAIFKRYSETQKLIDNGNE